MVEIQLFKLSGPDLEAVWPAEFAYWRLIKSKLLFPVFFYFVQPTKSRKPRSHSSKPANKTRKPKPPTNISSNAKSAAAELDILSGAAMENLYYISHNAMDCLTFRGFGWQHTKKTKKKKKRTKKKTK